MNLDILKDAAKIGLDNVVSVAGGETDKELMTYNKLQPEHFEEIAKKYGFDKTVEYIKKMEAKRLMKNG